MHDWFKSKAKINGFYKKNSLHHRHLVSTTPLKKKFKYVMLILVFGENCAASLNFKKNISDFSARCILFVVVKWKSHFVLERTPLEQFWLQVALFGVRILLYSKERHLKWRSLEYEYFRTPKSATWDFKWRSYEYEMIRTGKSATWTFRLG